METPAKPIRFAGAQLDAVRHVCAFFNSNDDAHRVLLPFMSDGLSCGDKVVHIVNPGEHHHHRCRLQDIGVDIAAAETAGQYEIRTNIEEYLPDGKFDKERMLAFFENMTAPNARGGFPVSRIVCHMDWAANDKACVDDVIEFEARVNDIWRRNNDAVICVYDLAKFGGAAVIDIMRTHPMVVIGGALHQNPFFEPPEVFLRNRDA